MRIAPTLSAVLIAAPSLVAAEGHSPAATAAFEAFGRYVVQTGLQFARVFVELRYEDITVDLTEGAVAVHGLSIRPPADLGLPEECLLGLELFEIGSETVRDYGSARIDFSGVDIPLACLPPEPQFTLASLGYERLRAETLSIDYDYNAGSSALNAVIRASFENGFDLEAAAEFDYFSLQVPLDAFDDLGPETAPSEPEVVADLAFLEISLTDTGGLERAGPMVEAMLGGLDQAPMIVQGGLMDVLSIPGADNSAAEGFATEAAEAVQGLVSNGDPLVVTIHPDGPVRLEEDLFDDPQTLFTVLRPRASGIVETQRDIIDPAILAAAMADAGEVTDSDRLLAGRALATGVGAPKSRDAALVVLAPLVDQGDAEAAMLSAEALADAEPEEAYRLALTATAGGAAGAQALLNRTERRLSAEAALSAQADASEDGALQAGLEDAVAAGDVGAIRTWATAAARGQGRPRNIPHAYGAARLAAAAGDRGAAALADRLARRYGRRADGAEWTEAMEEAAAGAAMAYWIEGGLGARLMAR